MITKDIRSEYKFAVRVQKRLFSRSEQKAANKEFIRIENTVYSWRVS